MAIKQYNKPKAKQDEPDDAKGKGTKANRAKASKTVKDKVKDYKKK